MSRVERTITRDAPMDRGYGQWTHGRIVLLVPARETAGPGTFWASRVLPVDGHPDMQVPSPS
jgi:hypothetical protein